MKHFLPEVPKEKDEEPRHLPMKNCKRRSTALKQPAETSTEAYKICRNQNFTVADLTELENCGEIYIFGTIRKAS